MEYIKCVISDSSNPYAYFAYKNYDEGKNAEIKSRNFPLELIIDHDPKLKELVSGDDIDTVYYEQKKHTTVNMITDDGLTVGSIDDEDIAHLIDLTKKICLKEVYDELLAPPSVDQQVEDFIKEFFEDEEDLDDIDNDKPLDQKDFLAEFFAELEDDSKDD